MPSAYSNGYINGHGEGDAQHAIPPPPPASATGGEAARPVLAAVTVHRGSTIKISGKLRDYLVSR